MKDDKYFMKTQNAESVGMSPQQENQMMAEIQARKDYEQYKLEKTQKNKLY